MRMRRIGRVGGVLMGVAMILGLGRSALADPSYTVIDLGTGPLTYGTDASGGGTVTGSSGLTYAFDPSPNDLPAQWQNTTQGVPIAVAPDVNWPMTYGNPAFAYSSATLSAMNAQGLAAGIDQYGVAGHLGDSVAFITQQQADGSWGEPTTIWSGDIGSMGAYSVATILGVSSAGQVLGAGFASTGEFELTGGIPALLLYDAKSETLTNISSLINGTALASGGYLYVQNAAEAQIDSQGRILLPSNEVVSVDGPEATYSLLLVPDGVDSGAVTAPEPTTLAVFALLIAGLIVRSVGLTDPHRARPDRQRAH